MYGTEEEGLEWWGGGGGGVNTVPKFSGMVIMFLETCLGYEVGML